MFENLPNELIFAFAGAFVLGWILASIAARMRSNSAARKQDPRDARIRELEAEVRIAQSDNVDSRAGLDKLDRDARSVHHLTEHDDVFDGSRPAHDLSHDRRELAAR